MVRRHTERGRKGVRVVALDLTDTYRSGLHPISPMPSAWPIPSTSPGWPTAPLTRCAGASRTRHSGTEGARSTRSFASASSCSKATNASTSGARTRCWPGGASAIPRRGARRVAGQGISEERLSRGRPRRGGRAARQRHCGVSLRRGGRDPHLGSHLVALEWRDLEPSPHRRVEWTNRGNEFLCQAGEEAGRASRTSITTGCASSSMPVVSRGPARSSPRR